MEKKNKKSDIKRELKISQNKSGAGSRCYSLRLPVPFIEALQLDENMEVVAEVIENMIVITKRKGE